MKRLLPSLLILVLVLAACTGPAGPKPGFQFSVMPATTTIQAGSSSTVTVTVTPTGGAVGTITFTAELPSELTVTPLAELFVDGVESRELTVAADAMAAPGEYSASLVAHHEGSQIGAVTIAVIIGSADPDPDPDPEPQLGRRLALGAAHTLFLDAENTLWAWGHNGLGQLGFDPGEDYHSWSHVPVEVNVASPVAIDAGTSHNAVVLADGTVLTWGGDYEGQLGSRDPLVNDFEPEPVLNLTDVITVRLGGDSSFAQLSDGAWRSWGYDYNGQLAGESGSRDRHEPALETLTDVEQVSMGAFHGVALDAEGTVWAWGRSFEGQLGDGQPHQVNDYTNVPVEVPLEGAATRVAAGGYHSLALLQDGRLFSWGMDYGEALGHDGDGLSPSQVGLPGDVTVVDMAAGMGFSLVLLGDGTVLAFGENDYGQLGNGTNASGLTPVEVQLPGPAVQIAAGEHHAGAILEDGSLYMWGRNWSGELAVDPEVEGVLNVPREVSF